MVSYGEKKKKTTKKIPKAKQNHQKTDYRNKEGGHCLDVS